MTHTTDHSTTPTLREHVAQRLQARVDQAAAAAFLRGFPDVAGETQGEELRRLNRYWRSQLAGLKIDTIEQRGFLVDDCEAADWLRLFDRGVLPTVAQHKLPMV